MNKSIYHHIAHSPTNRALFASTLVTLALVGCIDLGLSSSDGKEPDNQVQVNLKSAQSQNDFKDYLTARLTQLPTQNDYGIYQDDVVVTLESSSEPVADAADSGSGNEEFSGTNNQVTGVDEADIWKYDGTNFFILKQAIWDYHYNEFTTQCYGNGDQPEIDALSSDSQIAPCHPEPTLDTPAQIRVVKNDKTSLATFDLDNTNPSELYLKDDTLVVLGNKTDYRDNWGSYQNWQNGRTDIRIIDVSNLSTPQQTLKINLDGYVVQSRRIGNELFLITRFTPNLEGISYYPNNQTEIAQNENILQDTSLAELLPNITINEQQQALVNGEDCLLADTPEQQRGYPAIATITRINISSGEFSSRCMAAQVDGIYMSENSLYLFSTSYWDFSKENNSDEIIWNWGQGNTHLHKFEIESLDYQGSAILPGRLGWNNPRYRLGELNDGNLGIVTSQDSWRNPKHYLTVLGSVNGQLTNIASLPNEAQPAAIGKPGERIFSVRFMQDRAYIVTFENTDPLYVIDLANSSQPVIAGELEIPGFSDYLHPVGDDLLLGVGQSGNRAVKVSLFNVGDIQNPSELGNIIIGEQGSSTLLSRQPHAFAGIQQEDQYRFAFPISVYGAGSQDYWSHSGLYLFNITDMQLNQDGALITNTHTDNDDYQYWNDWDKRRGLIQGDDVYFLKGSDLYQANWNSPEQISEKF